MKYLKFMPLEKYAYAVGASLVCAMLIAGYANIGIAFAFTFGGLVNISNTSDASITPQIITSGDNVYIVWEEEGTGSDDILFSRSTNNGTTFDSPVNLSDNSDLSDSPQIAVVGGSIYVVWRDVLFATNKGDIFFIVSTDGGSSFSSPVNLSNTASIESSVPKIAAVGNNVYVSWQEDAGGGIDEVLVRASVNSGSSFGSAINVSNSATLSSTSIQIAVSGNDVYLTWVEAEGGAADVFFARSTNSGTSFDSPINVSDIGTSGGLPEAPRISVSGSNIYLVWGEPALTLEAYFARSTDGGATFESPVNISNSAFVFGANADVYSSGSDVYVIWQDESPGLADIFFVKSSDSGASFDASINISNTADFSSFPRITASSSGIFVVWQEDNPNDVFFSASTDDGLSFASPVNLSANAGTSTEVKITTSNAYAYAAWQDDTAGNNEAFFLRIADSGPASISIQTVSDTTPRWGIDSVSVSGIVNGNSTDTITVEWGDGTSSSGNAVTGNSWGPISHTYSSANTGTNNIVAKLFTSTSTLTATSSTSAVDVQKHATSLTISDIFSVVQGASISVTGTLTDTDASSVIASKTIMFNGTGAGGLSSVSTSGAGAYSASGASPNTVSDALTVQAHFAGDTSYLASDSAVGFYDTVATGTAQFNVLAGTPSPAVTLTGFNASIVFDDVQSSGIVYVASCSAPASARYVAVSNMCLTVSPAVSLGANSAAHITITYNEAAIPTGYTESDIDLFHQGSSVVDITESRNTASNTVTGKTTDFSKFIGGAAVHSVVPSGAVRKQVFVGDDNDLLFNFSQTRTISFEGSDLEIGQSNTVTVTDPDGNTNSAVTDTVTANIKSRHDPTGITITLTETGANTSVFTGSFTLISGGTSSSADALLSVNSDDEVTGTYDAYENAPFRVLIEGVTESGMAELVSYSAPNFIFPVGDAYELRLIDASLGSDANLTITMSYENVDVDFDPLELRMFHMDGVHCEDGITYSGSTGHDTSAKTVKGNTTVLGQYSLGLPGSNECPPEPGGAGGGLPRPGTGIVLDAVASVAFQPEETSSGGGGGKRTAVVQNNGKVVTTYPEPYFVTNPLAKVQVEAFGNAGVDIKASVGEQISIAGSFTNHQNKEQSYAYIVQIVDKGGFTVDVKFQTGILQAGGTATASIPWMATDAGEYQVRIFVWDSVGEVPAALSEVATGSLEVSA